MNLFVYGAGGTGREILDIYSSIKQEKFEKCNIYFVDDYMVGTLIDKIHVLDFQASLNMGGSDNFIIAVGEPLLRDKLFKKIINNGFKGCNLIHKNSVISSNAILGDGVAVYANSVLSNQVSISNNVMIQFNTVIGHDVKIKENTVVSSSVVVGGGVEIGENVFIGMGVIIKEKIKIGSNSIIGMGAVVYQDVPEGMIAIGNPARVVRSNVDQKVFK